MKKLTTLLILILSLGVYSQEINITYDETLNSYVITSEEPIEKIVFTRLKEEKQIDLKTLAPRKNKYVIPNKYFKYKYIRVTASNKGFATIQDFITKNKRE